MKSEIAGRRRFRFHPVVALIGLAACSPLRAQEPTAADFTSTNDLDKRVFVPEAAGFRLRTPEPKKPAAGAPKEASPATVGPTLWWLDTTYAADGDFEYSVSFAVTDLGAKTGTMPGEANAEMGVLGRGARGHMAINVNVDPKDGKRFSVVRISPNLGGQHFNIQAFPRKSDVGRLSVRRVKEEVIFLAADGADAPYKELVRYPYDPTVQPNFRLSAFHYQGVEANPVNVLFTDVRVKAERIVRGPQAGHIAAPAPPPPSYPMVLDYSRNPGGFLADFPHTDDKSQTFRLEADGLRIRPPVSPYRKGAQGYYYRESRYSVVGDLEWSCTYDADKFSPHGPEGYGSTAVGIQLESNTNLGSLALSVGATRTTPLRYGITRHSMTAKGGVWDTQEIRNKFRKGTIILRRTGSVVTLLAQGDGDAEPFELCRQPWTSAPIKRLRLSTDQGGNCSNTVDVKLTDIRIKARSFLDEAGGQTLAAAPSASLPRNDGVIARLDGSAEGGVVLEAAPELKSRKWTYLILGGIVLSIVVLGILIAVALMNRRKAD